MKTMLQLAVQISGLFLCLCSFGADQKEMRCLYKGCDTNGNLVVEGILILRVGSANRVRGDWKLHEVKPNNLKKLGPQIGSGKLVAETEQDKINLDLNPGLADNNVIFSGQITTTNIFGTWGYYGFAGQMVGGKFYAAKK